MDPNVIDLVDHRTWGRWPLRSAELEQALALV